MSEWYDSQRKATSNFPDLIKQKIERAKPRRKLTAEELKDKSSELKCYEGKWRRPLIR